jgi:hypothetical protein
MHYLLFSFVLFLVFTQIIKIAVGILLSTPVKFRSLLSKIDDGDKNIMKNLIDAFIKKATPKTGPMKSPRYARLDADQTLLAWPITPYYLKPCSLYDGYKVYAGSEDNTTSCSRHS